MSVYDLIKSTSATQIQQVRTAGISNSPQVISPGTQGLPKAVSNVKVIKSSLDANNVKLIVSFDQPTDPFFSSAKVYIRYGTAAPSLVSEGPQSPITFNVPKTNIPATIIVQATGNWGSVPMAQCPTSSLSLNSSPTTPGPSPNGPIS